MSNSILLGAADNYDWNDIRPWVLSARQSGFDGDIYIILYRVKGNRDELLQHLAANKVNVYEVHHDPYMKPIQHAQKGSPTQAHNLRFYHAWELLTRLEAPYDFVMMTDLRDVIFQTNPFTTLQTTWLWNDVFDMVASSEGIDYQDEEWGKDNLIQGFGQLYFDLVGKTQRIFNVGVLAGTCKKMMQVFHTIFRMTEGRYYPSDQSSFNILIQQGVFKLHTLELTMHHPWAAQLGTTQDPSKAWLWERLKEPRPIITEGEVFTAQGEKFAIVHQWDRVPSLKQIILDRYK